AVASPLREAAGRAAAGRAVAAPRPQETPRRDRARAEEGSGAGRPRTMEGAPSPRRFPPPARRRARRLHARPLLDLAPGPREPRARARGRAPAAGAARPGREAGLGTLSREDAPLRRPSPPARGNGIREARRLH